MSNIIISSGTAVLANAGTMLSNLALRHSRAKDVYQQIMDKVNVSGVNDDLYREIVDLLGRFKKTKITFNEERAPITTAIDSLKKPFVNIENDFDIKKEGSMSFELKKIADVYAKQKALQEQERNKKLQLQQAYDNELKGLEVKSEIYIKRCLLNLGNKLKADIDTLINSVDVENQNTIREEIITMDVEVAVKMFENFVRDTLTVHVGDIEKQTKFAQAMDGDIYKDANEQFESEIFQYQQLAIQKIPAIIEELQDIEAAESEEEQRLLEKAKTEREVAEKAEKKIEEKVKELELHSEEQTKDQAQKLQSSFSFGASEAEIKKDDIKKKITCNIELVLPAGLQEIFKFWITHADIGPDESKIRKWTIDRMIKFAEKEYNRNGNKIISQYVSYRESVEAKV